MPGSAASRTHCAYHSSWTPTLEMVSLSKTSGMMYYSYCGQTECSSHTSSFLTAVTTVRSGNGTDWL
jgi:hypothetical protein